MAESDTTRIPISRDTWKLLNSAKEPGESFDDVICRVADFEESTLTPPSQEADS